MKKYARRAMTMVRRPSCDMLALGINLMIKRRSTYENEDPSPTIVVPDPFHKPNSIRENPTKSTSQRSSREEQCDSVMRLGSLVPHGKVEHHTGKQSTLSDSEEESRSEKTTIGPRDSQ